MDDSWSKKQFEELAQLYLGRGIVSGTFLSSLQQFFNDAFAHYENATTEGKAFVDDMMAKVPGMFDLILKDAPDTADTRRLRRAIGLVKGKLPQAKNLIDHFPILTGESDKRIDEATDVLC